jgi:catechol-2,3-dioxygenase
MGVTRLGLVHLRVTDLEEAREHYSDTLGMTMVAEQPGQLHLKCWGEWDHHSLVLEEGGVGLVKGCKCQSAVDLDRFEQRSQRFGATTSRVSKGENLIVGRRRADRAAVRAGEKGWYQQIVDQTIESTHLKRYARPWPTTTKP